MAELSRRRCAPDRRGAADLYAPLMQRLKASGGTLAKLSFTVRRVADFEAWAKYGEDKLFDLRTGPFKGIGSLARLANDLLRPAWTTGDSAAVSSAMTLTGSSR